MSLTSDFHIIAEMSAIIGPFNAMLFAIAGAWVFATVMSR